MANGVLLKNIYWNIVIIPKIIPTFAQNKQFKNIATMANIPDFKYAPMFQLGKDDTEYYLLTKEGVSVSEFEGKPI